MISKFRQIVFESEDDKDVLYQTKVLFSNLLESQKKSVNMNQFFYSLKDIDGNIYNPNEQKDADEFLTKYIDDIEKQMDTS